MNKIFRGYLSVLPLCLGLYHIIGSKDDSTSWGLFMTLIGWLLTVVYGYYFAKWLYEKLQPVFNKKDN